MERLKQHRTVSISFPATIFFGHNLNLTKPKLAMAGKNKTGNGSTNLEIAVSKTALLAASFDFPYVSSLFSFYMLIPSYNSFYLIIIKLVAPANADAR